MQKLPSAWSLSRLPCHSISVLRNHRAFPRIGNCVRTKSTAARSAGESAGDDSGVDNARWEELWGKLQGREFPKKLAFAFDIDGVLKQGPNVLPQAKRVAGVLNGDNPWKTRIPFLMITNGGGHPDEVRRKALIRDLGVDLTTNQLVQSHTPLRELAKKYADKDVLVLGGARDYARHVAKSYGLQKAWIAQDILVWRPSVWTKTDLAADAESFTIPHDFTSTRFAAIFALTDSHDWGRDTTLICELMSSDGGVLGTRRKPQRLVDSDASTRGSAEDVLPLYISNPDLEWQSDYPLPRFGQGAFRTCVEAVHKATTGLPLRYTQFGKPHAVTYNFASDMLKRHVKELGREESALSVYMVGDNPESDIAGANAFGWPSILVRTGVYREGTPRHEPTTIQENVEEGVRWAIERETRG